MFTGFDLKITEHFFNGDILSLADLGRGQSSQLCSKEKIERFVISKFEEGESLNGQKILSQWFLEIKCDVFISHAHSDERLANAFAGWLHHNFKIRSFIDSNTWNYIDSLLTILNEYSDKRPSGANGWIYDYNKCNRASQHANIMLLMSLQKMIDNVEAVFFLNTDNSINAIDRNGISSTYSPWIYAELMCADLIRKKPLSEYRDKYILENSLVHAATENRSELKISYSVSIDNLGSSGMMVG